MKELEKGFTIVEILVVIAIVAIVGMILVTIFANTLRGSSKSQILAVIKQNGQAVLENIDKNIRSSDNVVCTVRSNLVVQKGGIYTRYRYIAPSPSSVPTVNGMIKQDKPVRQIDFETDELETDTAFFNRVCNANDPMDNPLILTDTNTQSGVSVSSASFSESRGSGFKTSVTIQFALRPGVNVPLAVADQIDPVVFQTTIQLR